MDKVQSNYPLNLNYTERIKAMSKIPVALQMYTLRNESAKDFVGTLKKVAEVGYAGVELAGYGSLSASDLRKLLDDLGLKRAGSHVGMNDLQKDLDRVTEFNLEIGNHYIVYPSLPKEMRNDEKGFREAAKLLNSIGEKCSKQGLGFCYHNHNFEFQKFGGKYALDILYEAADPKFVQAEVDVYWAKHAGVDPADYIRRYPGRCPFIHLKDMAGDADRSFAEVGEGIIDFDAIFKASQAVGTKWYVVEQDLCKRPPLESVRISLENLRAKGIA